MKNAFEELIEAIPDEEDRAALAKLGEKHRQVKDGYLRQSDYSREMNRLSEEKKQLQGDLDKLGQWNSWRQNNWDDEQGMTKAEREKIQQIEELNAELSILKSGSEAGMTFEEVSAYMDKEAAKRGYVTKDYFDKEVRPKVMDREAYAKDVDERMNRTASSLGYVFEEALPLAFSHRDEFGEVMKPGELLKFANENGIKDLSKAYDTWVQPRRSALNEKKTEELVAKAREEGRVEALKTQAMGENGRMPVDSGAPAMGHLEARVRGGLRGSDESNPIPEDMKLGSGVSNSVAALYRKDVAEGKVLQS